MANAKSKKDLTGNQGFGLKGRVVTMKSEKDVFKNCTLYVNGSEITALVKPGDAIPKDLKDLPVFETGGTIFPGLIELHNHLSYNCLPLWPVPKKFTNRDQWAGIDLYKNLISGPMSILGKTPGYVEAIVRYVECKCLVAGVTTSQGIMLFSNAGIRKYYQGIIRNVESPANPDLKKVDAHIPDIASKDATHFLSQLKKASCLLLHLSEGTDESARNHFESLHIDGDSWAITDSLAGIHCVALKKEDFNRMKQLGASMVWSPLSNLMLYGATADIASAKASGITIGLGSDWAPSGSKNLLGELKTARLHSDQNGTIFSNYELISMATLNAAKIIKWDQKIGTIEPGKLADLLIVDGLTGDPFDLLIHASEKDLSLVVINGEPRCGSKNIMKKFSGNSETVDIGDTTKLLNLVEKEENPVVGKLQLSDATTKLKKALKDLKAIAKKMPLLKEITGPDNTRFFVPVTQTSGKKKGKPSFVLVLDHDGQEGGEIRTQLPQDGLTQMKQEKEAIVKPEDRDIPSIKLDPLCVDSDKNYFKNLKNSPNLPDYIKTGLEKLYS
jgi:5-methylthioadenosine/S-adenosylhomocysteine deaminase